MHPDDLPTAAELAAMRNRCDKATAGPWFVNDPPWGDGTSVHNRTADPHGATEVICIGDDCGYETPPGGFRTLENMELIAHSRTDLPRCLALIDKQAEEIAASAEREVRLLVALDDALDHLSCEGSGSFCGSNINGIDYRCTPCELKQRIKELLPRTAQPGAREDGDG